MSSPGFVIGFHGCDKDVGEKILAGEEHVSISQNSHDWLGTGAYFWENSPLRAMKWAELVRRNPQHFKHRIENPFVIGAIIDTGTCLDLGEAESLKFVKNAHAALVGFHETIASPLPVNEPGFSGDLDLVKRHLDCAVINFSHDLCERLHLGFFDTVRGVFPEGSPLYKGARIMENTHTQICVRNPRQSIRGYFRPIPR